MKLILALAIAFAVVGCGKPAETSTSVGRDFVVDKLFTHEGCSVYRFSDGGYNRYYTNCNGSTNWSESCGNNCHRPMGVD